MSQVPARRTIVASPPSTPKGARRDYTKITTKDLIEHWRRERSDYSAKCYSYDLKGFSRFLGFGEDTRSAVAYFLGHGHAAAEFMAADYKVHLQDLGRLPKTVNRHIATLKSIVRTAHELAPDAIPWTLRTKVLPINKNRDTRGPGPKAVAKILARSTERGVRPLDIRNTAILHLLAAAGLRIGEVLGLDLQHVEASSSRVWILGKQRSEREPVTLPRQASEALAKWMSVRPPQPGPLFVSWRGRGRGKGVAPTKRRLSQRHFLRIVKRIAIEALGEKVGRKATNHGLRHTAITLVLDLTDGNVRMAQRFSRHRSLDTLMMYDDNRRDLAGEASRMVADALDGTDLERTEPESRRKWEKEKRPNANPEPRERAEAKAKVRRRRAARSRSRSASPRRSQKKPETP